MRRVRPWLWGLLATALTTGPSLAAADPSPALSAHDWALLNRVTWGANASNAAEMTALGPRLWLERQLHPSPQDRLPPDVQRQIDALPISTTPMVQLVTEVDAQRRAASQIADPDQKVAANKAYQQALNDLGEQAVTRSLLRDVYSPDQLQAQMTWFWANHFNVHMRKGDVRAMIGDYEEQAIGAHALGRFRDLLEATLRHPAMLRYLDNAQNAAGHINENYAREIMELHTMGVGSGYTQKDVQELARILTGVGIDLSPDAPRLRPEYRGLYVRDGVFAFNPNRHDFGDKVFLGHAIKGSGFAEVEQALDILSRDPATARHVSLQLATYFSGDQPPAALVDAMARTFQRTDGDIAAVLQTLFASRAFDASLGHAFKDPMHYAISAVRLAYDGRTIVNARPLQTWVDRLDEAPFNHETPDGYPLTAAAWNGPGQMALRFEVARQIASGAPALFTPATQPAAVQLAAVQAPMAQSSMTGSPMTQSPMTQPAMAGPLPATSPTAPPQVPSLQAIL